MLSGKEVAVAAKSAGRGRVTEVFWKKLDNFVAGEGLGKVAGDGQVLHLHQPHGRGRVVWRIPEPYAAALTLPLAALAGTFPSLFPSFYGFPLVHPGCS